MAFKMKGFPLHSGTSPAKQYKSDAQRKAIYASKAERSAAKQKSADLKTLDELIEEGFTPADARRMQKDKAVTGVEKETDKQKMQRLEDEAAKANKAGDTEKAKKLMAQVSKLEDKIQGTTKPPTKQGYRRTRYDKLGNPIEDSPELLKSIIEANRRMIEERNKKKPTGKLPPERKKKKETANEKPPTKQIAEMKKMAERPQMLVKDTEALLPSIIAVPPKEVVPKMPNRAKPVRDLQLTGKFIDEYSGKKKGKKGPGRRSKVGKKLTKVANIFRKKGNKRSPDFK